MNLVSWSILNLRIENLLLFFKVNFMGHTDKIFLSINLKEKIPLNELRSA